MHLTSRRRRALAVVLTAAVAAVAPMGAAQAQTKRHTDGAADMVRFDDQHDGSAAPEQVDADITTWSLAHSTGSITIKAAFTDLSTSDGVLGFSAFFLAENGRHPTLDLVARPGSRKGRLSLTRSNGDKIHCATSHAIDYSANTVVIKMARACLDKPEWVRGELISYVGAESGETFYADDGLSSGFDLTKFTGRAYRG